MRKRLIDSILTATVGVTVAATVHAFGPPGFQSYWVNRLAHQRNVGKYACLDGKDLGRIVGTSFRPWRTPQYTSRVWQYEVWLREPQIIERRSNGAAYRMSSSVPASLVTVTSGPCADGQP
jgi:hypothetical protein